MKKKITILLALAMVISVTACKKQPKNNSSAVEGISKNAAVQEPLPEASVLPKAKIIGMVTLINGNSITLKCSKQYSDNNVDYYAKDLDISKINFDGEEYLINITDESIVKKIYTQGGEPQTCTTADIVYGAVIGVSFSDNGKELTDIFVMS